MTDIAYVWSLGASSCLEKGVIYNAAPEDKTVIDRKETKYKTRPGVNKVKPKGWLKYSLQIDKGVVWDCSTKSLSMWETYIWSILYCICLSWMLAF